MIFALLVGTIIFNPAYALLDILLGSQFPDVIKYLLYVLVLTALLGVFAYRLKDGVPLRDKPVPSFILAAAALLIWTIITISFSDVGLKQGLRGLSVNFIGILLFITIWMWRPTKKYATRINWTIFYTLVFLMVITLPELINNHAFRLWSGRPLDNHFVAASLPQLRSLTPGPNPLGTLMTVLAAVTVLMVSNKWWRYGLLTATGLTSGMTYARSAWLGAATMGSGTFFQGLGMKRFKLWPVILGLSMLTGIALGAVRYQTPIADIFFHGESTEQHQEAAVQAAESGARNTTPTLIGYGIGTTGPVVLDTPIASDKKYPKISESWYIQLVQEIGLIGLALYLWFYMAVLRAIFKKDRSNIIGWLGVGLAINAIFLHVWSSDMNVNLMFWTLAGLSLFSRPTDAKE